MAVLFLTLIDCRDKKSTDEADRKVHPCEWHGSK